MVEADVSQPNSRRELLATRERWESSFYDINFFMRVQVCAHVSHVYLLYCCINLNCSTFDHKYCVNPRLWAYWNGTFASSVSPWRSKGNLSPTAILNHRDWIWKRCFCLTMQESEISCQLCHRQSFDIWHSQGSSHFNLALSLLGSQPSSYLWWCPVLCIQERIRGHLGTQLSMLSAK